MHITFIPKENVRRVEEMILEIMKRILHSKMQKNIQLVSINQMFIRRAIPLTHRGRLLITFGLRNINSISRSKEHA